jgi:hypothetical protein
MIGFVSARYGEAGLITLAVVVSLIEFAVVMDGVGMALQPLIGTYFGERNHQLIRRVMRSGVKAAVVEGIVATLFIWAFARQFCALFGISGGAALDPSISALRIVSLGFTFCSLVSFTTSYYMLIDHIGMATCFACLQNGLLYMALPILGSTLFGINGMWAGFAVAPILTLICAYLFVYLHFGQGNFPFLLKDMDTEILVLDDTLSPETTVRLSEAVSESLIAHRYPNQAANHAALFVEETGLIILEKNEQAKKPVLVELSVFFEDDSVLIIQRDSGELFDLTDPKLEIRGLSGFVIEGLKKSHEEMAYLVTTGYNRNMIRIARN